MASYYCDRRKRGSYQLPAILDSASKGYQHLSHFITPLTMPSAVVNIFNSGRRGAAMGPQRGASRGRGAFRGGSREGFQQSMTFENSRG